MCLKCKQNKGLYKTKDNKKRQYCIMCQKIHNKEYYLKNKVSLLKKAKKYSKDPKVKIRVKAYKKIYNENNKERIKHVQRKNRLMKEYGLTFEEYNILMKKQKNKCALCKIRFTKNKKSLIDHNHKTGKVRGILCYPCNNVLGQAGDSIKLLQRAIEYLCA